mgnify:CR=1 FL=1
MRISYCFFLSINTACCHLLGALSVRWMQPAQQHGLRLPSSNSSPDSLLAGLRLLGIFDPANKLIATKRSEALPKCEHLCIRRKGSSHIFRQLVDGPLGYRLVHRSTIIAEQPEINPLRYRPDNCAKNPPRNSQTFPQR